MSLGIIVRIINNTDVPLRLTSTVANNDAWESAASRPDTLITGSTITARFSANWHFELSTGSARAVFTVNVNTESGDVFRFDLEGRDAPEQELRRELPIAGAAAAKYTVFQCTAVAEPWLGQGTNWRQMTIAIASKVPPRASWMKAIPDAMTLDQFTIPGTHHSATYRGSGTMGSVTQSMSIRQQLENGIRWLDLRLNPFADEDDFQTYHNLDMTYRYSEILGDIQRFLSANPSETVITSISYVQSHITDEAATQAEGVVFDKKLRKCLDTYLSYPGSTAKYYTEHSMPNLGKIRGYVVPLRRDPSPTFGMFANTGTKDNDTYEITNEGVTYYIEDEYAIFMQPSYALSWQAKFDHVQRALETTLANQDWKKWSLIFTSATTKTAPVAGYYPADFAKGNSSDAPGVNGLLFKYLISKTTARFGTVIMDYPEFPSNGSLIDLLLSLNF
jgi:1-phosphatidylinositol phosphodiesterase